MRTRKSAPLQPASAAVILGIDWIADLLGSFFMLEELSRAMLWGAVFCGVVVFLVERVTRPSVPGAALAKGAAAAAVIAAPGPVLGTVVALCALAWWALIYLAARSHRSR